MLTYGVRSTHLGILFALTTGCMQTTSDESDVLYGHITNLVAPGRLVMAAPYSHITVCGAFREDGAAAIRQWAAAAGRAGYLTISSNCSPSAQIRWTIYDAASSHATCLRYYPKDDAGAFTDIGSNSVYFCKSGSEEASVRMGFLLHEFGHVWGMCDQYSQNVGNGNNLNCDASHSSAGGKVDNSIMGSSRGTRLLSDDIQGARALAARTDVPSYAQWANLRRTTAGTTNKPTTGATTATAGRSYRMSGADINAWYDRHAADLSPTRFKNVGLVSSAVVAAIKSEFCQYVDTDNIIPQCGSTTLRMGVEASRRVVIGSTINGNTYYYDPPATSSQTTTSTGTPARPRAISGRCRCADGVTPIMRNNKGSEYIMWNPDYPNDRTRDASACVAGIARVCANVCRDTYTGSPSSHILGGTAGAKGC